MADQTGNFPGPDPFHWRATVSGEPTPPATPQPVSPPPASGDVERLKDIIAAMRAIVVDTLAVWQGEDELQDSGQKWLRSARARATLRHRLKALDAQLTHPTPGEQA